ncbi:MAG TPA: Rne/Rng family ribonuclease [Candidatus Azoamicus sp. OHIO2]
MNNILLINKNEIGEIRVAFIENGLLNNFEIETNNRQKGNIFKGFITKIEIGLDAFFIDYGSNKDGFLPFTEISKDYLDKLHLFDEMEEIKDYTNILGKSFIVQIEKEECNGKGASLTTYLNIAGCYLVLMPYSLALKGISKKINDHQRFDIKEILNGIDILNEIGIIVRTFGHGKKKAEFKMELLMLLSQLKLIKNLYANEFSTFFIYEHNNLIVKTIRDYLKFELAEIIIDDIHIFNFIYKYLSVFYSNFVSKITLYLQTQPLFTNYHIEQQLELLLKREIFLQSGGSITIDSVEALTFIDINSSKSNKCDDIEETALQTNLEALKEIVKQLKIRDLGGLIIIDFIDIDIDGFTLLEKKLKELLSFDKAKIQLNKISQFGLLEMSRERIKSIFGESNFTLCYKCHGTGKMSNINTMCLIILKAIENELIKKDITQINIELPNKISNYMINFKTTEIKTLENNYIVKIILIANEFLLIPDYKIYIYKTKKIKIHQHKIQKTAYLNFFNYKKSQSITTKHSTLSKKV